MDMLELLVSWFCGKNKVLVSLSGGVDSALVAYAAFKALGENAIAVSADYQTLSKDELESAKSIAKEIGISHVVIQYNELENDNFVRNDNNRCFYCRDELSGKLLEFARKHNVDVIVDGTQLDDLGDYRPGITALRNNGIQSPLVETGFTKQDVRNTANIVGLSIYDKPSNSCLASRIPWGQRVTSEKLARIEMGERIVKQCFDTKQVRVRDLNGIAKIEVDPSKVESFCQSDTINQISKKLEMIGFNSVIIDPHGYQSGNLNLIYEE